MSTETILVILLAILIIGALPTWPYSRGWGYSPSGIIGVLLIVIVVWALANSHSARDVGQDIKYGVQDAGHELKDLGHDVKESVKDAVN